MAGFRDMISKVMPKTWAAQAEAESRQWMIRCEACGYEQSVWDAGGMRWKADWTSSAFEISARNILSDGWPDEISRPYKSKSFSRLAHRILPINPLHPVINNFGSDMLTFLTWAS